MEFTLSIKSDNEEPVDDPQAFVAMTLHSIAMSIQEYVSVEGLIRDSYGNIVGEFKLTQ